jgi:hypothetical protein
MSIRVGTSWRTAHGRSWISMPLWLLILTAPFYAAAIALIAVILILATILKYAVILGQSIVEAIRKEHAGKTT